MSLMGQGHPQPGRSIPFWVSLKPPRSEKSTARIFIREMGRQKTFFCLGFFRGAGEIQLYTSLRVRFTDLAQQHDIVHMRYSSTSLVAFQLLLPPPHLLNPQ